MNLQKYTDDQLDDMIEQQKTVMLGHNNAFMSLANLVALLSLVLFLSIVYNDPERDFSGLAEIAAGSLLIYCVILGGWCFQFVKWIMILLNQTLSKNIWNKIFYATGFTPLIILINAAIAHASLDIINRGYLASPGALTGTIPSHVQWIPYLDTFFVIIWAACCVLFIGMLVYHIYNRFQAKKQEEVSRE